MINISIGDVLTVNGVKVKVIVTDNIKGRHVVESMFDREDVWTVSTDDFDEI